MGTLRLKATPRIQAGPLVYDNDKLITIKNEFISNMKRLAFNNARSNVEAILGIFPGLRPRKGEACINGIVSVKEGLRDSSLSQQEAKDELIKIRTKFLKDLTDFLKDESDKGKVISDKDAKKEDAPVDDGSTDVEDEGGLKPMVQETLEEFLAGIKDTLAESQGQIKTYSKTSVALRGDLLKNNFVFGKAPVLPITKTPLSAQALRDMGFQVATIGDYVVLEQQYVIGIRHAGVTEDAEEELSKKIKSDTRIKNPSDAVAKATSMLSKTVREQERESEQELVELVQNTYRSLSLVDMGSSHWADATWYWLVPAKHLNLMARCSISKGATVPVKVQRWSLPFAK